MAVIWPGMLNGRIPLDQMVNIVNAADRPAQDGDYMNPAAAYHFLLMQRACFADTGVWIGTEEAYRSYETQAWYAGPDSPLAPGTAVARVGESKHGWGLANDLENYEPAWAWLEANAGNYGFSWEEGRASRERWHWVYVGSLDATGLDWSIFDEKKEPERIDDDTLPTKLIRNTDGLAVILGPAGYARAIDSTESTWMSWAGCHEMLVGPDEFTWWMSQWSEISSHITNSLADGVKEGQ